jgi:superfamily II DNA/RNA helicase
MIQGGGNEHEYEVPLINGVDVLICATPLILLRMLGTSKTNLERMQYMVLDEAHLLLEKYSKQILTLMDCYHSLLSINDEIPLAQFILSSANWSHKLRSFMDRFILEPMIITTSKLEASFMGECMHILRDATSITSTSASNKVSTKRSHANKLTMLARIVHEQLCHQNNSMVVFLNTVQKISEIVDFLRRHVFLKLNDSQYYDMSIDVVTPLTYYYEVAQIEKKWKESDDSRGHLLVK